MAASTTSTLILKTKGVKEAYADIKQITQPLSDMEKAMDRLAEALAKNSAALHEIATRHKKSIDEIDKGSKAVDKAKDSAKGMQDVLDKIINKVRKTGKETQSTVDKTRQGTDGAINGGKMVAEMLDKVQKKTSLLAKVKIWELFISGAKAAYQAAKKVVAVTLQLGKELARAVDEGVKHWEELNTAAQYMGQALANNQALAKENAKEWQDWAGQLSFGMGIETKELSMIVGRAAEIGNTKEEVKQIVQSVLDATVAGKNADQVLKSLASSTNGNIDSLRRIGVSLSDSEKVLVKTANSSVRLKTVLGHLKGSFGGLAEAAKISVDRQQEAVQVAVHNIWGEISSVAGGVLYGFLRPIAESVKKIGDDITDALDNGNTRFYTAYMIADALSGSVVKIWNVLITLPLTINHIGHKIQALYKALAGGFENFYHKVVGGFKALGALIKTGWAKFWEPFIRIDRYLIKPFTKFIAFLGKEVKLLATIVSPLLPDNQADMVNRFADALAGIDSEIDGWMKKWIKNLEDRPKKAADELVAALQEMHHGTELELQSWEEVERLLNEDVEIRLKQQEITKKYGLDPEEVWKRVKEYFDNAKRQRGRQRAGGISGEGDKGSVTAKEIAPAIQQVERVALSFTDKVSANMAKDFGELASQWGKQAGNAFIETAELTKISKQLQEQAAAGRTSGTVSKTYEYEVTQTQDIVRQANTIFQTSRKEIEKLHTAVDEIGVKTVRHAIDTISGSVNAMQDKLGALRKRIDFVRADKLLPPEQRNALLTQFQTLYDQMKQQHDALFNDLRNVEAKWADDLGMKFSENGQKIFQFFTVGHQSTVTLMKKMTEQEIELMQAKEAAQEQTLETIAGLIKSAGQGLADTTADIFEAMGQGTADVRQSFFELFQSVARNVYTTAITEIVNGVVEWAVKGAKSAAEIPYVGWVLAGGVAATTLGLLGYYKGKAQKPSIAYANGGYVSEGLVRGGSYGRDSVKAELMPGERVLSKQEAKAYAQGQNSSQNVNIVVNVSGTFDTAASTSRCVREVLVPELRRAIRQGYALS